MDRAEFIRLCEPVAELVDRKGKDYNQGVRLEQYFPLGHASHITMIHLKALRLVSLLLKDGEPVFESIDDTCSDLLAYVVFYLKFLEGKRNEPK